MTDAREFNPVAGRPVVLAPNLALVLAPNPSPMTYLGTNTFLLGAQTLAVIDPGPDNDDHLRALTAAIDGRPVSHIFVTHSHLDHSPLARRLSDLTGAAIYAFGDSFAGRSTVMQSLAAAGLAGGGEGIDPDFKPDHALRDGDTTTGDWGVLTAIHTPGHIGNHLCFQWGDTLFTGDHVMGWASSLVSPPDGDLTEFMASCAKLQSRAARIYYPAHGAPITDPAARLNWLMTHRKAREAQILAALAQGDATPQQLTKIIYQDTPPALQGAAARNVFAHLVDLHQREIVAAIGPLAAEAAFTIIGPK
jgi:glyoxylase-like metal-dependent hydrolase (beta-lactamase superfamily II)